MKCDRFSEDQIIRTLDKLFHEHGNPACICADNGPEFVATEVQEWLKDKHVDTHYIDQGSPWQKAYCESFNSIFWYRVFGSMVILLNDRCQRRDQPIA